MITAQTQGSGHALARKPDARHFVLDGKVDENIGEQRMNVEVQMAVDVVEIADELEVTLDLRAQFVGHRGTHRAIEVVAQTRSYGIVGELARRVHCRAESRSTEHAATEADDSMQTNVERGIVARQFGGGRRCGLGDHQARATNDAVAMRTDDAGVHLGRETEVIGVDDKALQSARF
jgi:hypothetical protein